MILAKKHFGQNFLIDQYKLSLIANACQADCILEIGPGTGKLTKELHKMTLQKYIGIEIDKQFATHLAPYNILWQSVLDTDFKTFQYSHITVGNLPYNITALILIKLLQEDKYMQKGVFCVQKEMYERIVAQPNTKQYSRFSVVMQWGFRTKKLFSVPANCFMPIPKVDSIVIECVPNSIDTKLFPYLNIIITQAFKLRRKQLKHHARELVDFLECNPQNRAEDILVEEYIRYAQYLAIQKGI